MRRLLWRFQHQTDTENKASRSPKAWYTIEKLKFGDEANKESINICFKNLWYQKKNRKSLTQRDSWEAHRCSWVMRRACMRDLLVG